MATNRPLVPSMIFRSRMTKALSRVTEQKAIRRSLFSSTSLMRTSVMTTVVLLYSCGGLSGPAPDKKSAGWGTVPGSPPAGQVVVDPSGLLGTSTQGEQARPGTTHEDPGRTYRLRPSVRVDYRRAQFERCLLQAVVERPSEGVHISGRHGLPRRRPVHRVRRDFHPPVHVGGRKPFGRLHQHQVKWPADRDRRHHLSATRTPGRGSIQKER